VQTLPQPPQLLVVVVAVAQPPRSGAEAAVQSAKPGWQAYWQVVPLQVVLVASAAVQTSPHPVQFDVVERLVSQPFVSGAAVAQSAKPGSQPVYVQVVPVHAAPTLLVVSHAAPHAPQLLVVSVGVSQPFVSGGVVLQSAKPALHPVYTHVPATHDAPRLFVVSHVCPHAPQLLAEPPTNVSQPLVSAPLVSQSA
jgi:hypothetical protein